MSANKGLLVQKGMIEGVIVLNSDHIHRLIGNWFTTCFNIESRDRKNVTLTGYCDDEFLLRENPAAGFNVVLEYGTLYASPYPIGGPIVILATSSRTGNSLSLVEDEMERFYIDERMGIRLPDRNVPTLRYRL